jgi:predicted transcriptional regulator
MTIKQKACEVISRMPEDSTFEDIQYYLYVLECIERGERDIEDGKILTHDEAENRLAKWLACGFKYGKLDSRFRGNDR